MNHRPRARRAHLALLTLPLAVVALVVTAASCDDGSHPYNAQQFDRQRRCLGPAVSLDVVTGSDPGAGCAVKCLVPRSASGKADTPLYVSTQCPPYPALFDTSGTQPGCDEAIAAMERGDHCLADGGSSHPGPTDGGGNPRPDGGGQAQDAAGDSASDATLQDASLDADASDT
ncbi:hypothetical protein [Pendulispora albinea]|uniref:Secreted protein n=1 Tax=Pendulispora albinea TaxID=2741071 RepID=A0ABZ2LZR6_9BACT